MSRLERIDRGRGLLGLLLTITILGAMAGVVVPFLEGDGGHRSAVAVSPNQTLSASPGGIAADVAAASAVACRAEYQTVRAAVDDYRAVNGSPPANMAALQTFLQDPMTPTDFTITIDPHQPGQIDVATGAHPAQAGDDNCTYAG